MRVTLSSMGVSTLLAVSAISVAQAEEAKEVIPLGTVTVYATRSAQDTFDVPSIVSIVDTNESPNAMAGDVEGLLQFTPGVDVVNGPRRNGQSVSIRGFGDNAIITLIDGRRQNFESAHDGRFFLDPSLLKRVEVVKGASSAIYGSGAVGGVVAFETKDASDFLAPGETKGMFTSLGYRSANDEIFPVATAFMREGGWDLLGSVTYRHSGDIEQGDGNELDTKDEIISGLFKAGYTVNDYHTLKLQAQLFNNDGQEPNNGAGTIDSSNPIVDKKIKDHQFGFKYAYDNPDNLWLKPKLHVYYNDSEVEEKDISGNNVGRVQTRKYDTLGMTIDNQSKWLVADGHQHTFSYGYEIYHNEQTGKSSFTGVRGGVPDAEATNDGVYLQDEIALDTNVGEFLVIPALRFDRFKSSDEAGNSQDESRFSPKLSTSYKPNQNIMFFGSWAQAFRAPSISELYPAGQHFPGVSFCPAPVPGCPPVPIVVIFPDNQFIANPNLKPEVVTTAELGAGLDFNNVFAVNDQVRVKGSYYASKGKDFINQAVDIVAGTTGFFNVDEAKIRGWELEGQYRLNALLLRAGLSYVKATNDDTGEYLGNNVPLTLVTDVGYQLTSIDSVIGWRGRFSKKNDRVGNNDVETDGYGVHDIYCRWAPNNQWKGLTVDVGIENLFDKDYTKRFASLLEEGRSYVARVAYQW